MKILAIIGLCLAYVVAYGIIHDQIAARVCLEYFTVGHPPLIASDSPTLLGLAWGILSTFWIGIALGMNLAFAARAGYRTKRDARSLVRPLGYLVLGVGLCALAAGIAGYVMAGSGPLVLPAALAHRIPAEKHAGFMADVCAQTASLAAGAIGAAILLGKTWFSRKVGGGIGGVPV